MLFLLWCWTLVQTNPTTFVVGFVLGPVVIRLAFRAICHLLYGIWQYQIRACNKRINKYVIEHLIESVSTMKELNVSSFTDRTKTDAADLAANTEVWTAVKLALNHCRWFREHYSKTNPVRPGWFVKHSRAYKNGE